MAVDEGNGWCSAKQCLACLEGERAFWNAPCFLWLCAPLVRGFVQYVHGVWFGLAAVYTVLGIASICSAPHCLTYWYSATLSYYNISSCLVLLINT